MVVHHGGSKMSQTVGQPLSLGWKPIIWQVFCQKLHENERNWTRWGRRRGSLATTLDPPMVQYTWVVTYVTDKRRWSNGSKWILLPLREFYIRLTCSIATTSCNTYQYYQPWWDLHLSFYRPQTKLREGNVFTGISPSVILSRGRGVVKIKCIIG